MRYVQIENLTIDLNKQIVYGPYDHDRIPVRYYDLLQEAYCEFELMSHPVPLTLCCDGDSEDGTRRLLKMQANRTDGYIYLKGEPLNDI